MAKLPSFTKLSEEELSDMPKGRWQDAIKVPLNDLLGASGALFGGGLTFAQNILSDVREVDINVPDPWTAATLTNSYANFGSGYEADAFMKHPDGSTELKGYVTGGTAGTSVPCWRCLLRGNW